MPSSDFFSFIEDFASIKSADKDYLQRTLKKYPYFATAALFLAKSNHTQETMQHVALRTADRKILRYWLDDAYRAKLEAENNPKTILTQSETVLSGVDIHTEEINAFEKLENKVESEIKIEEEQTSMLVEESFFEDNTTIETTNDIEKTTSFFEEVEEEQHEPVYTKEAESMDNQIDAFVPSTTTDSNFFDDIDNVDVNEAENKIKVDEAREDMTSDEPFIPTNTTDATFDSNFFDEVEEEQHKPVYTHETESIDKQIDAFVPPTTTDANFFEEIESDESIFKAAEKDLANYEFPEENKDKPSANHTSPDAGNDSSFFDDI